MFRVLMRSSPVVTAITDEDGVHDGTAIDARARSNLTKKSSRNREKHYHDSITFCKQNFKSISEPSKERQPKLETTE